jgi:hypothetical protein
MMVICISIHIPLELLHPSLEVFARVEQGARVLVNITNMAKDQNASSTVVTRIPGTMDAGVMQTWIPAPMLRPIHQLTFQAMEQAKLLVTKGTNGVAAF